MNKLILLAVIVLLLIYMLTMVPTLESDNTQTEDRSRIENFVSMNQSGYDPTNPSIGLNHPDNETSVKHGSNDTINNTVQMNSSHQPVGLLDRDPKPLRFKDDTNRPNIRDYNMAARRYHAKAPQAAVNTSELTKEQNLLNAQKADCNAVNKENCGLTQAQSSEPLASKIQPSVRAVIEGMSQTTSQSTVPGLSADLPLELKNETPIPPPITKPRSSCSNCDHSIQSPVFDTPVRLPPHRPEDILRMNRPTHDEYSRQLLKSGNVSGNPEMKRVDFVEFYNDVSKIADTRLMSENDDGSSDVSDVSSDQSSDLNEEESCDIASKCSAESCGSESLHPILDPRFNMREAAKQALLLEDHINNTKKRCFDCIRKHFLITDGLLEEAVSLETDLKKRAFYRSLYMKWLNLEKQYASNPLDSDNLDNISQQIRLFRKPLVEQYFDLVKDYELE